jgi:transcriptional regulator with XRE-family HTH domain
VTPDEIKTLRRAVGVTQKQLAQELEIDVVLVRDWEKGERFPTKAHCEQMAALRARPPARKAAAPVALSPMALLADPAFFLLVRKLLAHAGLRAEVTKLAESHPDPLDDDDDDK